MRLQKTVNNGTAVRLAVQPGIIIVGYHYYHTATQYHNNIPHTS